MSPERRIFGAVEAGGSKFVCAIADENGAVLCEERFQTTDPHTTLSAAGGFLRERSVSLGSLSAIGVASFGPIGLTRGAANYGFIGSTPKAGWANTNILGAITQRFTCPVGFDTDVNAAALAEHRWGAGRDIENLVYLTVGTGIGGGVLVDGVPLHGLMHPEVGHLFPRRPAEDRQFEGVCPFHRDCFEGLASGPAIVARAGAELQHLDAAHHQWELEADYLGQLCAQLVLTLSPQRIVMGGGVMSQERLLPAIRRRLLHWLGGYVSCKEILLSVDEFVVPPLLGPRSGVLGALALALDAARAV